MSEKCLKKNSNFEIKGERIGGRRYSKVECVITRSEVMEMSSVLPGLSYEATYRDNPSNENV